MPNEYSQTVSCPECSGSLTLSGEDLERLAGMKLECPRCGKLLRLPDGGQAPQPVSIQAAAAQPSLELKSRQQQQQRSFLGLAVSVLLGGLTAIAVYFLLFDPADRPARKPNRRKPADARVVDGRPRRIRPAIVERVIDPSMFPDPVTSLDGDPDQQAVKPDGLDPQKQNVDAGQKTPETGPAVAPHPEPAAAPDPKPGRPAEPGKSPIPLDTDVAIAKLPIPDAAAQKKRTEFIRDLFEDEYTAARPSKPKQPKSKKTKPRRPQPDKTRPRRALAEKLIAVASETHEDHVARYVLLREARDAAAMVGGIDVAFQAIDLLCRKYAGIDAFRMKADVLVRAVGTAQDVAGNISIGEQVLSLLSKAVLTDDYENIGQLETLAIATARKTKNAAFLARARNRIADVRECEELSQNAHAAKADLDDDEYDPQANLAVGTFLCFAKNDWANGLPMLVRASEPRLKSLAEADLAAPRSPDAQLRLGDAWWGFDEGSEGLLCRQTRSRAAFWYRRALPNLSGLEKVKAAKRIDELKGN